MKNRIEEMLPQHTISQSQASKIYIVDYTNFKTGSVELFEIEPEHIKYVLLENKNEITVCFDGFEQNALEISKGYYSRQCECVVFPTACSENDWVLFIETKYTNDVVSAFREEHDYPNCMISQIVDTVNFFRDKGILESWRRATAIVSFPNLVEAFNSTFFTGAISELDILKEHNILIRATNSANIISAKRIKLNSL